MKKLHGNIVCHKCRYLATRQDGSGFIGEAQLENRLAFSLAEMRRWLLEDIKHGKLKSVEFLSFEK